MNKDTSLIEDSLTVIRRAIEIANPNAEALKKEGNAKLPPLDHMEKSILNLADADDANNHLWKKDASDALNMAQDCLQSAGITDPKMVENLRGALCAAAEVDPASVKWGVQSRIANFSGSGLKP